MAAKDGKGKRQGRGRARSAQCAASVRTTTPHGSPAADALSWLASLRRQSLDCCGRGTRRSIDAVGHAEIRTTADLYTHLVKQTATKAARTMDAVLG